MTRPSLSRHLLLWALGALFLVWGSFVVVAYRTGIHEADELTDGHLASAAAMLLNLREAQLMPSERSTSRIPMPGLRSHDYQQSLSIVVWNAQGALVNHTGEAPLPAFSAGEGFADLQLGMPPVAWRSFSQWDTDHGRKVMVLLAVQERDDLASDIAEQIAEPGMWLLPVVSLALGLAVWRGLRPLYRLSDDVARLDAAKAERLIARHPYREFDSVVHSINTLIDGQQAALLRERQLASEVAHELRTPLASLALQAKALQSPMAPDEHGQALQRVERDALKAGHVLAQLLALARASRSELAEAAQPVELQALAQRVAAEYAQAAWDGGQEIGVSDTGSVVVSGHPLPIEMALRNLVENALRHTPAGTVIEIQTGQDAGSAWLQVCDRAGEGTGQGAEPGAEAHAPRARSAESLGLGLKIVARVAEVHSGHFERLADAPDWRSCYRLSFAVAANAGER
ncbi:two-component sensor histidine kinase [Rhodoferax koreense]|uniref:histidine kinase n=1 Tax=Rhodoferax koreensis TaxID=1842727 RepID=A0A1P8K2J9_9BURK|nr:histidine kinase dimerization/phospho-acceptor domain-containing protein [Rhodoferax koreense]APW40229.1 two-component sensor histidine kinase [Rhodoferax koreense]